MVLIFNAKIIISNNYTKKYVQNRVYTKELYINHFKNKILR